MDSLDLNANPDPTAQPAKKRKPRPKLSCVLCRQKKSVPHPLSCNLPPYSVMLQFLYLYPNMATKRFRCDADIFQSWIDLEEIQD